MSDRGAPRRDRRKLAEALARLSQGLREGDDPLYDPWTSAEAPTGPELARPPSAESLSGARRTALAHLLRRWTLPSLPAVPHWAIAAVASAFLLALGLALFVHWGGPER